MTFCPTTVEHNSLSSFLFFNQTVRYRPDGLRRDLAKLEKGVCVTCGLDCRALCRRLQAVIRGGKGWKARRMEVGWSQQWAKILASNKYYKLSTDNKILRCFAIKHEPIFVPAYPLIGLHLRGFRLTVSFPRHFLDSSSHISTPCFPPPPSPLRSSRPTHPASSATPSTPAT